MQPGDAVWEKFGHNAIWVHDNQQNIDLAYNWGLFDFDDVNFFTNFAKGLMKYSVGVGELDPSIEEYRDNNRTVWAQELNLSPEQTDGMIDQLIRNELPENRTYLYNYFDNNCSTKVRDVIDLAVSGQLKAQLEPQMTSRTWRWESRRLTQDSPLWYTALNTVYGPPCDRPLNLWEDCFIPGELHDALAGATITDVDGTKRPLVRSEGLLIESTRPMPPQTPKNWIAYYAIVGLLLGGVNLALLRWSRVSRAGRVFFATHLILIGLALGICGAIGLYFWIFTDHWAAWRNANLLPYSPLGLLVALSAIGLVRGKRFWSTLAVATALAIAGLSALAVLLRLLTVLHQVMSEPLALVLPINFALAYSVWIYSRRKRPSDQPANDPT